MEIFINNKEIDAVIFDMDGTFYPIEFYQDNYYKFAVLAVKHFLSLSDKDCISYLHNNGIAPNNNPINAASLTDLILNTGVSLQEWNRFRDENFILTGFKNTETVSLESLIKIAEKADIFIMTNNTDCSTKRILQELCIPRALFKDVVTSQRLVVGNKKMTKEYGYSQLATKYKYHYNQMLAVGDRYFVDIQPLTELGGNGILVEKPTDIDFIADLIQ